MCHGELDPSCGALGDGGGTVDTLDAPQICVNSMFTLFPELCFDPAQLPDMLVLAPNSNGVFDTDQPNACRLEKQGSSGGDHVCIIAAHDVRIEQPVRAIGGYPLAIIALNDIDVTASGGLDASSDATHFGAGFSGAGCVSANGAASSGKYGGGGAGGAYGGFGGDGGDSGTGDAGGKSLTKGQPPLLIRGGCPGSPGGNSAVGAGMGGGGLYLRALHTVRIAGPVLAGGAGGQQQLDVVGAAGGGSGGMVAIEAATVVMEATAGLCAAGGGGAGGNEGTPTVPGAAGGDATGCDGGSGGNMAARGGHGAGKNFGPNDGGAASPGGSSISAGGGGGGGAGMIFVRGGLTDINGDVFPAPMM